MIPHSGFSHEEEGSKKKKRKIIKHNRKISLKYHKSNQANSTKSKTEKKENGEN